MLALYQGPRPVTINGVNILKSIDEGPFQMGTFWETLTEGTEDKERYNADIRATNILLQGLPKDIYSLINHYTDAKDIWDNVNMLLEGSELTKEDRESQLYDDFEHFRQNKGETIHDYYVRFAKLINDMRNIKMTMSRMQLNSKFVNNCCLMGHQAIVKTGELWFRMSKGRKIRGQGKQCRVGGASGYEEQISPHSKELHSTKRTWTRQRYYEDVVSSNLFMDLAINVGQCVSICTDCDAFDSDVDEAPTAQTMFMANLSSTDPVYDKAGPSYDSDILSEIAPPDYSKENYLATFTPQKQLTPEQIFWSQDLIKMKAEALKEQTTASRPIKALTVYPPNTPATLITQLTKKVTVLQEQNELFGAENGKIKQHYKELYDSIKITHAKHIEQTTALTTENENLKAQMQTKMKSVTKDHVKPTVLAPGKYAIDVEPIPPHNRNNREVHLDYLRHLKESVETLCEIVEEAKELLEYAIGTCPKGFNKRDKKHALTPLISKKQVTFEEQCDTSNSNTHIHVGQLNTQQTNVPVPPSIGVNCCTNASGSQPRSNTKKNKISPAKGVNKKKVEEHPRTNKSNLKNHESVVQIILWLFGLRPVQNYSGDQLMAQEFVENFHPDQLGFENKPLGAIMGYGDYVIGDSVISRAPSKKGYRIYNKRTRRIMQTIHVQFDELTEHMAPMHLSTGPAPTFLTHGQISSGLVLNPVFVAPYVPLTNKELEILFQPMFDEYMEPPRVERPVSPALAVLVPVNSAGVAADSTLMEDNPFSPVDNHPFINVFALEPSSEASSYWDLSSA
ncbi:hypothetical protein Tco_0999645 [Tanacetum coccineum]